MGSVAILVLMALHFLQGLLAPFAVRNQSCVSITALYGPTPMLPLKGIES